MRTTSPYRPRVAPALLAAILTVHCGGDSPDDVDTGADTAADAGDEATPDEATPDGADAVDGDLPDAADATDGTDLDAASEETGGDADVATNDADAAPREPRPAPASSAPFEVRVHDEAPIDDDGSRLQARTRYLRAETAFGGAVPRVARIAHNAPELGIWAATDAGVMLFTPDAEGGSEVAFDTVFARGEPALDLSRHAVPMGGDGGKGMLALFADRSVWTVSTHEVAAQVELPDEAWIAVDWCESDSPIAVATTTELWLAGGVAGAWRAYVSPAPIHQIVCAGADVLLATDAGVLIVRDRSTYGATPDDEHALTAAWFGPPLGAPPALSIDVCAPTAGDAPCDASLESCAADVIVGTATGVVTARADCIAPRCDTPALAEIVRREAGAGGLARGNVSSVACGPGGWIAGHDVGASTSFGPQHSVPPRILHMASGRWLLGAAPTSVAMDPLYGVWTVAPGGMTYIRHTDTPLAAKADARQAELDRYFWRTDGFVSAEYTAVDPWNLDVGSLHDNDNDGLWTQMMIGAWAFAAATTGDDAYCDQARRAMGNMLMLVDVPCDTFTAAGLPCGFIARSFVRDDEGDVYTSKLTQPNWHVVEWDDGHSYVWKDDTSSDELAGHAFGFPLFFDLCATPEEQEAIAERYAAVVDYIIDGGYTLIDLDGERTTHGIWNPDYVSSCVDGLLRCSAEPRLCAESCFGGGFLNGMEVLGMLLSAWHMTGETRFYDAYEQLIVTHRYDEVIRNVAAVQTLHTPSIENHSDHELMMLAFHTLLRYEPHADRRAEWQQAMRAMVETERLERNPLWLAWLAGLTGTVLDASQAVDTLAEFPYDQRMWECDQSQRMDFAVSPSRDRFGDPQFVGVPPYDEIGAWWWNGNPHKVLHRGNPRQVRGPMAYLLAYWSARYYGLLGAP